MPTAILYIRVSTDEQAEKGYSLKYQEDVLRNYCLQNNITIIQLYKEDYSAKNFRRPVWKTLLKEIRRLDRASTLYLLFTKWDRFSRNVAESYTVMKTLKELNVLPQAIEQPIDYSVPESKCMMAMYLAMPEVENDRRGLEVKRGMRKAQEEGRWMGEAPIGYRNIYSPQGDKLIVPQEPECSIITHLFSRMAAGGISVSKLYQEAKDLQLHCSRTNFYRLLHNPMYAGLIVVSADRKADRKTVMGLHPGLVSEDVFNKVQNLFLKQDRINHGGRCFNPMYPLKGYIYCPKCSGVMTASGSCGKLGGIYHYYHCSTPGHVRVGVEVVNNAFASLLKKMRAVACYKELYHNFLTELFTRKSREFNNNQAYKSRKIDTLIRQMQVIRDLMLDTGIDFSSYRQLRSDLEMKIQLLSAATTLEQQHLQHFIGDCEATAELFHQPAKLYARLGEQAIPRFLSVLLTKGWRWEKDQISDLICPLLRPVYGLNGIATASDSVLARQTEVACQSLMELIAEYIIEKDAVAKTARCALR